MQEYLNGVSWSLWFKKRKKKILLVLYDNPIKSQKPSQEALSKEKAAVLMYVPKSDLNLFRRNICIHVVMSYNRRYIHFMPC